ncbi:MAG: glycosyltransferase family 87 protein [Anaerolineales bacterium]|nr:glycosyltransferase family 87 protein [Anaerolineales bacterium]
MRLNWSPSWTKGLVALSFLALAFALVSIFASQVEYRPLDWRNYVLAASQMLEGGSPYQSVEFFGPPWLAVALIPLALLPASLSSAAWLLISVSAVFISHVMWTRFDGYPPNPTARLLLSAASVASPVALFVYITGQITPLVELAFIWLAIYTVRGAKGRLVVVAIASFLITSKPHIIVFPMLVVLLEAARGQRWRVPLTFSATALVAGIGAFLLLPSWPREWLAAIVDGRYLGGPGLVAQGYFGLREAGVPEGLLVLPAIYTLFYWNRHGLTARTIALSLASGLILIPYARTYDFIILWPSIITASGLWLERSRRVVQFGPILVFMLLPLSNLAMLLPVLAMGFLLLGASLKKRPTTLSVNSKLRAAPGRIG